MIKVLQQAEKTLKGQLPEQQLLSGFTREGSCIAAESLGVGDIVDVLKTLALIFVSNSEK